MQRTYATFPLSDKRSFKIQVLNWVNQFSTFCFLDSCGYQSSYGDYDFLAGIGISNSVQEEKPTRSQILSALDGSKDWYFGHLNYESFSEDRLSNHKPDRIGFPLLFFFTPQVVLYAKAATLVIGVLEGDPGEVFEQISNQPVFLPPVNIGAVIQKGMTEEAYLDAVKRIQNYILKGYSYEVNFCQEFFTAASISSPQSLFDSLTQMSPNPFAAFYRINDKYLFCASPERFLKKAGDRIYSQPIKGTARRDADPSKDQQRIHDLRNSPKEQSENVMVVDLVRNDLSKICKRGSVQVEELLKVYSFPQVHQLISTISGELDSERGFEEIFRATFPMGSMTGAPKKSTMAIIDELEVFRRGLFSGSVGYISPEGDFDFNVVIRSLLYDAGKGLLSFPTGSGITYYSDARSEYEECLLKASAIKKVLAV